MPLSFLQLGRPCLRKIFAHVGEKEEKIEMQQKLDEEEERLRAAEDEVIEQKEKLANAARKAKKEKKLNELEPKYDELSKTQGQSYFFYRC